MAQAPLLLDIKRNSLDDGPGIRSVVFFKGCPLSCVWCQNPESLSPREELQRDVEACAGCGGCEAACPHGVARPASQAQERDQCQACGACVDPCPAAARRIAGRPVAVDEALEQLLEDAPFYRRSGGGVTLSGGEPTMFVEYAGEIAAELRGNDIGVLLETCGQFPWPPFAEKLLPHLTTIYFDLKLADPDDHHRHCGTDNTRIHDNLARLVDAATVDILPRIPLVPGITDTPENLTALAAILRELGLKRVALLPYNPLWLAKRRGLGLPVAYTHDEWMTAEAVGHCEAAVREAGLEPVH